MPIMRDKLILKVVSSTQDHGDIVMTLDYKDLIERPQKSFFWANMYDAPQEEVKLIKSTENSTDKMNEDPPKVTKWRGRILMGVESFESMSPKLKVEKMSTESEIEG